MQILLVRHGPPNVNMAGFVSAAGFSEWVRLYKSAEVTSQPPDALKQLGASATAMFVSTSPRSKTSAALISSETVLHEQSLFDETYLPPIRVPFMRMRLSVWKALAYVCWFFGNCSGGESKAEAVLRAHHAARFLETAAEKGGNVMMVGHGGINRFIGASLRASGWSSGTSIGNEFWSVQMFSRV